MGCYDETIYAEMRAVSRRFEEDSTEDVWLTCEQATRAAERLVAEAVATERRRWRQLCETMHSHAVILAVQAGMSGDETGERYHNGRIRLLKELLTALDPEGGSHG